jgi:hypothetical protein
MNLLHYVFRKIKQVDSAPFHSKALFIYLMSRMVSVNKQCFSLTANQRTVLSAMDFRRSEQGVRSCFDVFRYIDFIIYLDIRNTTYNFKQMSSI